MPTIPVRREAGYRTDTIGRHAGGQFYAAGCSLPSNRPGADLHHDTDRRCYDYLHLFDADGRHTNSRIQLIGYGRDLPSTLSDLLATLDGVEFDDIAIQPFRLEYDGYTFGLIDESDPERGSWFELYPDQLGFHPPFNGDYDT
jgi:formate hydrogenlyase regulatory protein HycA